jgi:hypothetical protein
MQSYRTRDAKSIHANADNPRKHAPVSFFDLRQDPLEKKNLAAENLPLMADLEQMLASMITQTRSCEKPLESKPVMSDEAKESLGGLGYLGK